MCDPVTIVMGVTAVVGAVSSARASKQQADARNQSASTNVSNNFADAANQQKQVDLNLKQDIADRTADGRYQSAALDALGFEMGADSDAMAILQREAEQSTARDVDQLVDNSLTELDDIDKFKRNSRSQYKQSIADTKAQTKANNVSNVLNLASTGASLYMGSLSSSPPKQ